MRMEAAAAAAAVVAASQSQNKTHSAAKRKSIRTQYCAKTETAVLSAVCAVPVPLSRKEHHPLTSLLTRYRGEQGLDSKLETALPLLDVRETRTEDILHLGGTMDQNSIKLKERSSM